jgi:hypothetical protein
LRNVAWIALTVTAVIGCQASPEGKSPALPTTLPTISPLATASPLAMASPSATTSPSPTFTASPFALSWTEPVLISSGVRPGAYWPAPTLTMVIEDGDVNVVAVTDDEEADDPDERLGIDLLCCGREEWTSHRLMDALRGGLTSQPAFANDTLVATEFEHFEVRGPGCIETGPSHVVFCCGEGPGFKGSSPSLAFHDGLFHLAFENDGSIVYRQLPEEFWLYDPAKVSILPAAAATAPSLKLGPDGTIHVLFSTAVGLSLATDASGKGDFSVEVVPQAPPVDRPFLGVDDDGGVHVAWNGYSADDGTYLGIFYMSGRDGQWSEPIVVGQVEHLDGMAVDGSGNVHLVGTELGGTETPSGVWYFSIRDGFFRSELLMPGDELESEGAAFPSAIALDAQGRPHVAFSWPHEPEGLYYTHLSDWAVAAWPVLMTPFDY